MPVGHKPLAGAATGPHTAPRLVAGGPGVAARVHREVIIDHVHAVVSSRPAAGGHMEALLPAPAQGYAYLVERIAVRTDSATSTNASVYVGDADPENIVDYTDAGNLAVADELNPILVPGGSLLRVGWQNASDGAIGTARVQYRIVEVA